MDEVDNGMQSPQDPRAEHNKWLRDLNHMIGGDSPKGDFGVYLDRADQAYALAYDAGMMGDEPFMYPSVKGQQLQRKIEEEAKQKNGVVISDRSFSSRASFIETTDALHPVMALDSTTSQYPAVVVEHWQDNDQIMSSGSRVEWRGFNSSEAATSYLNLVGSWHEIPGLGDFDGYITERKVLDNPVYLAERNKEPQYNGVHTAETGSKVSELIQGLAAEMPGMTAELDPEVELVTRDLIWCAVTHNSELPRMLGAGTAEAPTAYLDPEKRLDAIRGAAHSASRSLRKTEALMLESLNGYVEAPQLPLNLREAIERVSVALTETLSTRYELRQATQKAFVIILTGMMKLAEVKRAGIRMTADIVSAEAATTWASEVDANLAFAEREASIAYAEAIKNFMNDKRY